MSKKPEKPKTRKAPAPKNGAKATAPVDPIFALIDAHKARTKEWNASITSSARLSLRRGNTRGPAMAADSLAQLLGDRGV